MQEKQAKSVLYHFLKENSQHSWAKKSVRQFFQLIVFMQKRIQDKLVCKDSKIDVLLNYWEKIEFQIMTMAAPNTIKGKNMD